ncbi:hypothetical protein RRG08_022862 [Elysia crispata]|uniref:Uncharacterized protein n=1 Tax=Elysia crispata TaxID=231223 RepID=A0AAE0Z0B7_9GAST|nr:hypothetical protein RRG08_022862 [Elysia crispata]
MTSTRLVHTAPDNEGFYPHFTKQAKSICKLAIPFFVNNRPLYPNGFILCAASSDVAVLGSPLGQALSRALPGVDRREEPESRSS